MDKRQVTVTFPKEELYILEDLQQLKEDYDINVSKFLRRAIKTAVNAVSYTHLTLPPSELV